MTDIYDQIGSKIRELRTTLKGKGISQEELARAVKTTANTVSRWETATYKPLDCRLGGSGPVLRRADSRVLSRGSTGVASERAYQRNCRSRRARSRRSDPVCPIQKGTASKTESLTLRDLCRCMSRPMSLILTFCVTLARMSLILETYRECRMPE
jgi:transcriptional regulator with XRE-family HTH domain